MKIYSKQTLKLLEQASALTTAQPDSKSSLCSGQLTMSAMSELYSARFIMETALVATVSCRSLLDLSVR